MSDWKEIKRPFREALIAAFNWDRLALVLQYHCDRRLDRVTSEKVGFENNVDDVIDAAVRDGWLENLAEGALAENEKHSSLRATVPRILEGVAAEGRAYYQGQVEGEKGTRGRAGEPLPIFSVPPFNAHLEVVESVSEMPSSLDLSGAMICIGRSPSMCDIAFRDDLAVSRQHAVLMLEGHHFRLFDENSTSGSWVNGRQVPEYGIELADGDEIHLGAVHMVYRQI